MTLTPIATANVAIAQAGSQFAANTREHTMTVLLNDPATGHRHLRFAQPRNEIWSFDIITWRGRLVFTGDVGHYIFANIHGDTLAFFGRGVGVQPDYWEEKVRAGRVHSAFNSAVFEHSLDGVLAPYRTELSDCDFEDLGAQARDELIGVGDADSARLALDMFHWTSDDGDVTVTFANSDPEMAGYDHFYLVTCHALRWAARLWETR